MKNEKKELIFIPVQYFQRCLVLKNLHAFSSIATLHALPMLRRHLIHQPMMRTGLQL